MTKVKDASILLSIILSLNKATRTHLRGVIVFFPFAVTSALAYWWFTGQEGRVVVVFARDNYLALAISGSILFVGFILAIYAINRGPLVREKAITLEAVSTWIEEGGNTNLIAEHLQLIPGQWYQPILTAATFVVMIAPPPSNSDGEVVFVHSFSILEKMVPSSPASSTSTTQLDITFE
ncbi:MAG: hypothetical protein IIA59_09855 [Candidatus Marinimicrobia bacterium]|nr:hypothetical protein [Candidatus Neomarinimicrobiota bacterium]